MNHPRTARRSRCGFALVTTLTLLMLIALIAAALLGLASTAMRKAALNDARAEAEANARLALNLAIGELQRELGPDRRITAPATILDADPDTDAPDGIHHGRLTGVWEARTESLHEMPDYDREAPFRRWLVSNAEPLPTTRLDFVRDGQLRDEVVMDTGGSGGNPTPPGQEIRAGRVALGSGRFAWWVSDENTKALINPADPLDRGDDVPVAGLLAGFAAPGAHGLKAVDGFAGFPANTPTSDKLATLGTLTLIEPGADLGRLSGHFSPHPRSVLASVTRGGLRRDLSLYLERTDINWTQGWSRHGGGGGPPTGPLGPNGRIALSNPDDHDVLAWKQLHHWHHMHRQQLADRQDLPLRSMMVAEPVHPVSNPAWNNGVVRINPVLVRMQMVISFGLRRQGDTDIWDMFMHSFPVVTLWNPYSVPLRVDEWSTFLHTLPLEHTVFKNDNHHWLTGDGTRDGNYNWGWPHGNMTMRVGGATGPGLTLAPGEAKLLSYIRSHSGGFTAHDMVEAPPGWLPNHAGQPRHLGTITGGPGDRIAIATSLATWDTSGTSFAGQNFQTTFDFRCEARAVHAGHGGDWQQKMFSAQVGWRHEPANPRVDFISKDNFPSLTFAELDHNPTPFLHLDVRLKTLDEPQLPNKTWLHNIPFHGFAAVTSTARHSGHGVDAATPFFAHPYTMTFEQVNNIEGLLQNRPFFGPSNRPGGRERMVSAAVPLAPLTSLAQLQNLPLPPVEGLNWSGQYFQNHAIGNSFASPGLAPTAVRRSSFPFHIGQYFEWQGGDIAGRLYGREAFNVADYTIPGAPAMVVDRSYAANQLLFDDYFFSSMAAQQGPVFRRYGAERSAGDVIRDFYQGTTPLPVAAYRPYHPPGEAPAGAIARLAAGNGAVTPDGYRKSASRLMVDGGFNVNSTSVEAWTAVLAAAHLKRPVTMPGGSRLDQQARGDFVISRNPNPPVADDSEDARWLGYRELTAEEIRQLAEALVRQVKLRGPFRSLGEFVNRRRTNDEPMALYGAVQAALEDPGVSINDDYRGGANDLTYQDIAGSNYEFPAAAMGSRYQGTPAYVSQADILTPIAPIIQVRSDTFVVRGYGEARGADGGRVLARAWCEAVVQRVPDYIDPAADAAEVDHDDLQSAANRTFGRRFVIRSFRWLPSGGEP